MAEFTGVFRSNPADGEYNDPFIEVSGSEATFFSRNILPVDQENKVATKL